MSVKIAFVGAGSFGFTRTVVKDILTFPRLADAEIALMDIDAERLEMARACCQKLVDVAGSSARIKTYSNLHRALDGADAVIVTILSGGVEVWKDDILIPRKYGVDICIGDTRGPSGVFRALRTIPDMFKICEVMSEVCPEAILLNYTNPMAILCHAMHIRYPHLTISGLCHSVQGTANMLAQWLGMTEKDIDYVCAGLNHMAWYLKFEHQGRDLYPEIKKAITSRRTVYNQTKVRNDLFLRFGYYITESSPHISEYCWWFRKSPELVDHYFPKIRKEKNALGKNAYLVDRYMKREKTWRGELQEWLDNPEWENPAKAAEKLRRGNEYASNIVNAWTGGELYTFNGNVPNDGIVTNLPQNGCVEVPVLARRRRLQTIFVGDLPREVLSITALTANNEMLAVEGALEKDGRKIMQSIACDPLTAAVLSLKQIDKMTRAMFVRNKEFLADYKIDV